LETLIDEAESPEFVSPGVLHTAEINEFRDIQMPTSSAWRRL
jgi:hypothetical protein